MPGRRSVLELIGGGLALLPGGMARAACTPAPPSRIKSRASQWEMETLWAYRFHADGDVPRPMGYLKRVKLTTKPDWVNVDFILGDAKAHRGPGGLTGITDQTMRDDMLLGISKLAPGMEDCAGDAFTRFSHAGKLSETDSWQVEIVPVSGSAAVAVRRFDRLDQGGVAFWDREIFLLRAAR